ncbi:MAG: thrombospondin type 3 repeat-containing protein [Bacteroidota bacterium]
MKAIYLLFIPIFIMNQEILAQVESFAPPAVDLEMRYYDRHKIDISNLREFYEGLLNADAMIHADGMFDAESKWKFTLYQMILAESNHFQARSAYQLSLMGVPLNEIHALWSPDYPTTVRDPRMRAAFEYLSHASNLPTSVTADTHAALRMHYTDRQIAELTDLTAINACNAVYDHVLPIATDQKTTDWATENLAAVGWQVGLNAGTAEEQRAQAFVGDLLDGVYEEVNSKWQRGDLSAANPEFETDWVNMITGYDIPMITFDRDADGVEDPFDYYPDDYNQWKKPGLEEENMPDASIPQFDVAAYDYAFFQPASLPRTKYPFSDRHRLDVEWTRQSSLGTLMIDSYLLFWDRAIDLQMRWELFFVYQLASGCVHCQVHGSFGIFQEFEREYINDEIPEEDLPAIITYIQSLMDFERSDLFTDAQKAAYRFARDAGPMPSRTTAAHIEDLRRYYSDREIQEIIANVVLTAWLATTMQSQATVTDRKSMSWALRNLGPMGWNPGVHTGWPNEQRPYHMSELFTAVYGKISTGEVPDAATEWVGVDIPLAVDTDNDGVDDAFDGFPNDPNRWADTDLDGIEDSEDEDIDGDGIPNDRERSIGIFPYKSDSDGDGIDDPTEIERGTDPVDPRDY